MLDRAWSAQITGDWIFSSRPGDNSPGKVIQGIVLNLAGHNGQLARVWNRHNGGDTRDHIINILILIGDVGARLGAVGVRAGTQTLAAQGYNLIELRVIEYSGGIPTSWYITLYLVVF